ncbi:hypothetical protein ACFE04_012135 [Oxalis oulophora]
MGGCFPCFGSSNDGGGGLVNKKKELVKDASLQSHHLTRVTSSVHLNNADKSKFRSAADIKKEQATPKDGPTAHIAAQTFTFKELANATKNFRPESLLGEGGFGRVYKGRLDSTGQVVAVKQLDRNGLQGNREFLVEVLMLSLLHHTNLVNLIGYCADGDQRLLVSAYLRQGISRDNICTFLKYRCGCGAKLDHVENIGVTLAVFFRGRKAIDNTRPNGEQNLVAWARPLFKDRRKFPKMADPVLQGRYPMRGLYQALAVAAMCLQEQAATRPLIGDVVTALTYLASQTYDPNAPTPRSRDERRSALDSLDGTVSPSAYKNSPDYRKREHNRNISSGSELSRNETGGGSGRKWGLDDVDRESQKGSPAGGRTPRNRGLDRERAVAEAKVWGENWREKKRANAMGSFDSAE